MLESPPPNLPEIDFKKRETATEVPTSTLADAETEDVGIAEGELGGLEACNECNGYIVDGTVEAALRPRTSEVIDGCLRFD